MPAAAPPAFCPLHPDPLRPASGSHCCRSTLLPAPSAFQSGQRNAGSEVEGCSTRPRRELRSVSGGWTAEELSEQRTTNACLPLAVCSTVLLAAFVELVVIEAFGSIVFRNCFTSDSAIAFIRLMSTPSHLHVISVDAFYLLQLRLIELRGEVVYDLRSPQ